MITDEAKKNFKAAGFNDVDDNLLKDIDKIMEWQQILKQVKTDGIEPMYNTLGNVEYISNDDTVLQNNSVDDILKNSSDVEDNYFLVPKIIK